jgi:hypothetical protein
MLATDELFVYCYTLVDDLILDGQVAAVRGLARARLVMCWGDMDAYGLEILNEFRAAGVLAVSMFMDLEAYRRWGRWAPTRTRRAPDPGRRSAARAAPDGGGGGFVPGPDRRAVRGLPAGGAGAYPARCCCPVRGPTCCCPCRVTVLTSSATTSANGLELRVPGGGGRVNATACAKSDPQPPGFRSW